MDNIDVALAFFCLFLFYALKGLVGFSNAQEDEIDE